MKNLNWDMITALIIAGAFTITFWTAVVLIFLR
jgi:hypothetical protein